MSDSEVEMQVPISRQSLSRTYSDKYSRGSGDVDLLNNNNANWTTGAFFKLSYICGILIFFFFFHVSQIMSLADCLTATNVIHGMVS